MIFAPVVAVKSLKNAIWGEKMNFPGMVWGTSLSR